MILTIIILFWICLFIVFYTYIGYGIILYLLVKCKRLIKKKKTFSLPPVDEFPEITLMICAYNEESVIKDKMKNSLSLDYPEDKLKFIWVTDGSNDNTNELLKEYDRVKIVFKPEREGKTAALNHGIKFVETPLVTFTDANTMLNKGSIREIVRLFMDPTVGCVSGEKRVCAHGDENAASGGEGLYWKYESLLKRLDSELYSAMGAAGELFAIRTELYMEMPTDTLLDDFIMSMNIVGDGLRIAYTDKAYAMEYGSADMNEESKRKRRIAAGGLQSIWRLRKLMIRHGFVSFQYVSHRVLRWSITPFALIALVPLNVMLVISDAGMVYTIIWILQCLFYLGAFLGYEMNEHNKKNKFLYVPYYFMFMNINVFRGIKYLKDKKGSGAWEKAKRA